MLWFALPLVAIAGKMVYDAVTDNDSGSSSSSESHYREEAEENRKRELAQRKKTQKEKMNRSLAADMNRVFDKYSGGYKFSGNVSLDKMRAFTKLQIEDEDDADKAIRMIAGDKAGLDWREMSKEASAMEAKNKMLLELYESLEKERNRA